MNQSKWFCKRCEKEFDLEREEGWIFLTCEQDSYFNGKLSPLEPHEKVCYECADDLLAIIEKCDKQCRYCDVTMIWGLSIMDCLKFQLKFDLIDLPQKPQPMKGSVDEAKEVLRIFARF